MTSEASTPELMSMERARSAYERGRLAGALVRGALLAASTALLGTALVEVRAWLWAPLTFALWSFVYWRGATLLSAAYYGLFAGALTFLFPMSLLRPCCRPGLDAGAVPCTMPEMCVLAGALIGLPLATWVLRTHAERRAQAAAGMALGALSLATLKCSALFAGEALGLLGGIGLAIATASVLHTRRTGPAVG